jgi:hypothetical protein
LRSLYPKIEATLIRQIVDSFIEQNSCGTVFKLGKLRLCPFSEIFISIDVNILRKAQELLGAKAAVAKATTGPIAILFPNDEASGLISFHDRQQLIVLVLIGAKDDFMVDESCCHDETYRAYKSESNFIAEEVTLGRVEVNGPECEAVGDAHGHHQ